MLYERSYSRVNLTEYDEALEDIQQALQHQPGQPRFLYFRSRIQRARGNRAEVRQDAIDVIKLIPDHVGALRILEELGNGA